MKAHRLVLRSLLYYWQTGAVVAFGVAVATAVVTGSLLVGDSVSGSIRDVALSRLGGIDHALVAPRFFSETLADEVARFPALKNRLEAAAAVIIEQGAATFERPGAPQPPVSVPRINVIGVDSRFWRLWPAWEPPMLNGRQVAVNAALARDLGVGKDDFLLVTVGRAGQAPADSAFAQRKRERSAVTLRLLVSAILPEGGAGNFALDPGTSAPRNVFVSLEWLARQLGKEGMANSVLVQSSEGFESGNESLLRSALDKAARPSDLGLRPVTNLKQGYVSVRSELLVLTSPQVRAAFDAARECGTAASRSSVYLADSIRVEESDEPGISYAVIAAVEPPARQPPANELDEDFILLNSWANEDLGAQLRQKLVVAYPVSARDGSYRTESVTLTLRAVLELDGSAADPGLVPDFEGITDARSVGAWDPPFPIDKRRITERDEQYWEEHKATPKALVPLALTRRMWQAGGGTDWVTSVRAYPPQDEGLAAFAERYSRALASHLRPDEAGLVFRPVRHEALAAAKGSTDFGVLFLSMSAFLMASGAGLAGMLMRLAVERRASEMGIMLAAGLRGSVAGRLVRCEGVVLAIIGAGAGAPLGIAYARGILHGLRTWWIGAVGTPALWLHTRWESVGVGFACGLAAGVLAVWWGVRRLRRKPVLELLSGWQALASARPAKAARWAALILFVLLLAASAALAALSAGVQVISPAAGFFGSGATLLAALLAGCFLILAHAPGGGGRVSFPGLAVRSAAGHRGRSMLAIGLLACAAFVIVTVAANERDFARSDVSDKASGAGGFSLLAVSSLPVHFDFGTPGGRARLGFPPEDEGAFKGVKVLSFLLASGEDISCRNLARATAPRVLGVRDEMLLRGGFTLETLNRESRDNPWLLLARPAAGEVPGFGDSQSVRWQLHKMLGGVMWVPDESGRPVALRFVGLISASVLASELLVSEDNFKRMYPSERAPRYFLIETPPGSEEKVAETLRRNLGPMGLEVRSTREVLNGLVGVQNTYLMTFLALGGLGVVLGTVGMVVVLLRNALERRGEFALMLATGFGRPRIAGLLVAENAVLLLAGLACGTAAALAAVWPQLSSVSSRVNWPALIALLSGIIVIGLVCSLAAAAACVRGRLINALRRE